MWPTEAQKRLKLEQSRKSENVHFPKLFHTKNYPEGSLSLQVKLVMETPSKIEFVAGTGDGVAVLTS